MSKEAKKKTLNVIIGTPSYDGKVLASYTNSLINTIILCSQHNININPLFICFDPLVQKARNDIFKIAYEHKADFLFFIDADQAWQATDFLKIIQDGKDISGAAVIKKSDQVIDFNVKTHEQGKLKKDGELYDVLSLGTGFMKISKSAIEKIYNYSEKYTENEIEKANVFRVEVKDGAVYSEDTLFCKDWIDNKGKVFVHPSIVINHTGTKDYFGNLRVFAIQNGFEG